MTIFLRDACTRFFSLGRCLCLVICGLVAASSLAQAQSEQVSFEGAWSFSAPVGDDYVLILKRNGMASYFRSDNQDRTVHQGTWQKSADGVDIIWPDDTSYTLSLESAGLTVEATGPYADNRFKAVAARVPDDILGQWAKPPTSNEDAKSELEEAKGYFGTWKIGEDAPHYVIVAPDRSAASNWAGSKQGERGLRGSWARQGSELHIIWDSGHYSILRGNERGVTYKRIEPGVIIENDTTETTPTTRVNKAAIPANWLSQYEAEREKSTGGVAFTSRKSAREFYRGYWLVKRKENAYERIEIGRFGGLSTSRDAQLSGEWRMSGQDLFLRWDNGMRKILSPVGEGFVLFQYRPGRPLDGVPTQIHPAAPEDTSKLSEYIENRKDVARMLTESAIAAGIDPKSGYGWGQSFMRWAWPFGSEESATKSDALIVDAYEAPNSNDPWWWPFWSEAPEPENSEATDPVKNATQPVASTEKTDTAQAEPTNEKTNWFWPF